MYLHEYKLQDHGILEKDLSSKFSNHHKNKKIKLTSICATNEAAIIAKASPASNVGAPQRKGIGALILVNIFYQNK